MAKLEKLELSQKMMIEPSSLRGAVPKNKTPFLYKNGIVVSLKPLHISPALLGDTSKLKFEVVYKSLWLNIIDKYVEVEVFDEVDKEGFWIGTLFGFNVRGEGGEEDIRPCRIVGIEGETLKAESLDNEPGNKGWLKVKDKVEELLNEQ